MITRLGTYSQIKGSSTKIPCRVATTGDIALSGTQIIDGISAVAGDRVLVWQQSAGANNGIYVVAAGAWSRAVDLSLNDDVYTGLQVYVNSGASYGGRNFVLTTSNPITLGVTVLSFYSVPPATTKSLGIVMDGGGVALQSGIKGDLYVPYNMTITNWTLLADVSGSAVVDVWKAPYGSYPPTVANTIIGATATKPNLSSQLSNQSLTVPGWTTGVSAGDTIRFNLDSATSVTRLTLSINGNLI